MKKFVKKYIKFKKVWQEEHIEQFGMVTLDDNIVLKAFEIFLKTTKERKR